MSGGASLTVEAAPEVTARGTRRLQRGIVALATVLLRGRRGTLARLGAGATSLAPTRLGFVAGSVVATHGWLWGVAALVGTPVGVRLAPASLRA